MCLNRTFDALEMVTSTPEGMDDFDALYTKMMADGIVPGSILGDNEHGMMGGISSMMQHAYGVGMYMDTYIKYMQKLPCM